MLLYELDCATNISFSVYYSLYIYTSEWLEHSNTVEKIKIARGEFLYNLYLEILSKSCLLLNM